MESKENVNGCFSAVIMEWGWFSRKERQDKSLLQKIYSNFSICLHAMYINRIPPA